jgi:hypothetical protein
MIADKMPKIGDFIQVTYSYNTPRKVVVFSGIVLDITRDSRQDPGVYKIMTPSDIIWHDANNSGFQILVVSRVEKSSANEYNNHANNSCTQKEEAC